MDRLKEYSEVRLEIGESRKYGGGREMGSRLDFGMSIT
jgi:hypothetical protein